MKIEKAIEIKGRRGQAFLDTSPDAIDEAERLSIEALKAIKSARANNYYTPIKPMPGETS